jgi:hypothetical protein
MNINYKYIYLSLTIILICSFSISLLGLRAQSTSESISNIYLAQSQADLDFKLLYKTVATTVAPNESNILSLSRDLIENSNYKYAKKWLQKGKSDEAIALLGELYIRENDYSRAIEVTSKIDNTEIKSYYLAKFYYISGDLNTGDEHLAKLKPNEKVCNLAIMSNSRILDGCREFYINNSEILNILSTNDMAHSTKYSYNLANFSNYPQLSLAILKRQVELGQADRDIYFELGNRLLGKGDYIGAKQSYLASAEKDRYFPQVYEQLLIVAEKIGDIELKNKSAERLSLLRL